MKNLNKTLKVINIKKLSPTFGAIITGIDLSKKLMMNNLS